MAIIIIGYKNPTSEGVTLVFNKPARLKTGIGHFKEIWVSWDRIGMALVNDYTELIEVSDLDKLRNSGDNPSPIN